MLISNENPTMVNIQLDGNSARGNQLTHGPPPSRISEKSMHESKYSMKTYNEELPSLGPLGKLRGDSEGSLEEEVLPLSVRITQIPRQQKEQRTSFWEFDF